MVWFNLCVERALNRLDDDIGRIEIVTFFLRSMMISSHENAEQCYTSAFYVAVRASSSLSFFLFSREKLHIQDKTKVFANQLEESNRLVIHLGICCCVRTAAAATSNDRANSIQFEYFRSRNENIPSSHTITWINLIMARMACELKRN